MKKQEIKQTFIVRDIGISTIAPMFAEGEGWARDWVRWVMARGLEATGWERRTRARGSARAKDLGEDVWPVAGRSTNAYRAVTISALTTTVSFPVGSDDGPAGRDITMFETLSDRPAWPRGRAQPAPPTATFRPFSGQTYRILTGAISVPLHASSSHAPGDPTVGELYYFTLWSRTEGYFRHSIYTDFPYGEQLGHSQEISIRCTRYE